MAKRKSRARPNPDDKYQMSAHTKALLQIDSEDDGKMETRPRAEINWDKVETAMSLGASLMECASYGGVHYNTLERRVQERYGELFRVVREAMMTDRRMMARKQLWNLVAKGNVRATLFVNRAINKINDRLREDEEDDEQDTATFRLAYNLDEPPAVNAEFQVQGDAE